MIKFKNKFQYSETILIIVCISYLSFTPPSTFEGIPTFQIPHLDKIVHLFLYTGFSLLLNYDFRKSKENSLKSLKFLLICILLPIFFGALVEIMQQQFFAPRTAEWSDWVSDIIGVFIGWLIFQYFIMKRHHIDCK